MNGKELRRFSHCQIVTQVAYTDLSKKVENRLILEFFFVYCKTVKVRKIIKFNVNLIYI